MFHNLDFPKFLLLMCDLLLHIVGMDKLLVGKMSKELKLKFRILNLLFLHQELKHKHFLELHFLLKIFGKQLDFHLILNFLFHNNQQELQIESLQYLVSYYLLFQYLCCNILLMYFLLLFHHSLLVL